MKQCSSCNTDKPLTDFYKNRGMPDGLLKQCKPCFKAHRKIAHAKPDAERERDRIAAWRANNPEKWKASRARADAKFYGSEKWSAGRARRAAQTKAIPGTIVSLKRVLEAHGRWCHICGKGIAEDQVVHFDHVVPLARGGKHDPDNLKPSHRSCNAWKADRLLSELVGQTPPAPEHIDAAIREMKRERRSRQMRERMAAMTPEQRAARGAKISASKKGVPHVAAGKPRAPRKSRPSPEESARRSAASKARMAAMTPEQRAERGRKISETKRARGGQGNIENLVF